MSKDNNSSKPPAMTGTETKQPMVPLPLEVVDRSDTSTLTTASHRLSWLPQRRRLLLIPLAMVLVMSGGLIGLYFQPPGLKLVMRTLGLEPGAGTDNPIAVPVNHQPTNEVDTSHQVTGLGVLLPASEVITIAPPYGSTGARIARLLVEEGDTVAAGEVIAELDNAPVLQAALDSARALRTQREAALAQARESTRASLEESRAELARVKSAATVAAREYERGEGLRAQGFISASELDERQTLAAEAAHRVEQAAATLSRYESTHLDEQVDVKLALRALETAQADYERAARELEQAYVRAPVGGTILKILKRAGEQPDGEGLAKMGDTSHMTAKVEIYQSQIADIQLGQAVTLTADALRTPLHGQVSRIGLEVERQTLIDDDPTANTDTRVVEVTVTLDTTSSAIASKLTHLQVLARIDTGSADQGKKAP